MIETITGLASAFGLSTSAGLNAYIPLLIVAVLAHFTDLVKLESPWDLLANPWIIILISVLLVIEVVADKIPAVDTINDSIQTFIRPAAGAILFAATTQSAIHVHPLVAMGCGVILAGGVHAVKMGARPALTMTTAGMANPIVSTIEDIVALVTSLVAVIFPYLILMWALLLITAIVLILQRRSVRRTAR